MAKKNKKDGQTNLSKSPKSPLRPLALVAAISTLIFVLLDGATFVAYMLYHFCVTTLAPLPDFTIGAIFYSNYITDSTCRYTDGTKVYVNWLEPQGEDLQPQESSSHPYPMTNAYSTLIWMIVGMILDLIWFVTTIPLYSKKRLLSKINSTFYPWLGLTTLVLIFQLIATCFYGSELQTYMDLLNVILTNYENKANNQLIAILIIPLFFSKGVLFWFYFFILHVIGYVKVGKAKKNLLKAPTMFGNNSHHGKSLDDEGTQVLNRRALGLSNGHNQDDFSDDEGDNPYSKNLPTVLQQASERRTSENWMFANDAFEPEYQAPLDYSESVLRSNQPARNFTNPYMVSSVPGYVLAQPSTQNTGNPNQPPLSIQESLDIKLRNRPRQLSDAYMSDVDSVASEYDRDHRRLGRPVIPKRDYPLPRAHSKKSKGARSIIRTPSGKYSSASEYLRGYAPQEAPVMEEDYGKRGYYSKQ